MVQKETIPPRDSWLTLEPGQKVEITPEVASDWDRQKSGLRKIRGNIIAYSIDIEFAIDVAIRELLFLHEWEENSQLKAKIEAGRSTFDRVISKSGALTFNNKINILKSLLSELQIISEDDRKRVSKLLEDVRAVRNKFAHTTLAFEPRKEAEKTILVPYIVEEGNRIYLDDGYFDKLNQLYSECLVRVENVTRTIQKVPLQPLPSTQPKTE